VRDHISSIYDNRSHVFGIHLFQILALGFGHHHNHEAQANATDDGKEPKRYEKENPS